MRNKIKTHEKTEGTVEVEALCREVLSRIEPSKKDREKIQHLTDKLQRKITKIVRERGLEINVGVEGSFAKDTWLNGEVDVDLFLLFPNTVGRERFERIALEVAEEALAPNKTQRRFAEHPYLEAEIKGIRVNIVPAYRVMRGRWRSATDRTPFHTRYIIEKLKPEKKREVRLLKKFMKGIGVYGAEIKVGGFSGYLSEILIMEYGSFLDTVRSVAKWRDRPVIDIEKHYKEEGKVKRLFNHPLIVIDPVDRQRNLASAVTMDKLCEFIAACKEFLKHPHRRFFFPEEEAYPEERLLRDLRERGTYCLFIYVDGLSAAPDVLWGQLHKSLRAICRILTEGEFNVLRSSVWSEDGETIFIIELESGMISRTREHTGPFVWSREADKFIEKYLDASETVYGPWIEKGRWMVRVKREHPSAVELVREKIGRELDNMGLGSRIQAAMRIKYELMAGNKILTYYLKNKNFARHLTRFLRGVPTWLKRDGQLETNGKPHIAQEGTFLP